MSDPFSSPPDRSRSRLEILKDILYRHTIWVFLPFLLLAFALVVGVYYTQNISIYEVAILGIGAIQAVVTIFLSFMVYSVSRESSEAPNLTAEIRSEGSTAGESEEGDKYGDFSIEIENISRGKAIITNLSATCESKNSSVRIAPHNTPIVLSKGQRETIQMGIEDIGGLQYVVLEVEEETIGTKKFNFIDSRVEYIWKILH